MNILYLNNFRGFKETFVEIKNVNFFVGENSTGKTSVLKILRALLNSEFWMKDNMSLEISDLGYFDEIVSGIDSNNTFFEVAIFNIKINSGIKLKYISDNGRPKIAEVFIINQKINIEFQLTKKSFRYRYVQNPSLDNLSFDHYLKKWVKQNGLGSEKYYENEDNRMRHRKGFPLIFEFQFLVEDLLKHETEVEFQNYIFGRNILWLAPIRSTPRRIYDNPNSPYDPDGSHTPFLLRDYFQDSSSISAKKKKEKVVFILNKFGVDSGLFESISVKNFENNSTSPFQLRISIGGKKLNFTNVGYGVSQILPLLVEIIISPEGTLFLLQQPEVHLHPRGQAAFGDFIYKSCIEENKTFVIETHSDYLIDRYRIVMSKNNLKNEENVSSQIIFFSKGLDGNKMTPIGIDNNGRLSEDQPLDYRDFFLKEQFDLLDI